MGKGSLACTRRKPFTMAAWLRPSTATRSLQPVAMSTNCRVWTYSPAVTGPQWWTRSVSKLPGAWMVQERRSMGTSRSSRLGGWGLRRGSLGLSNWNRCKSRWTVALLIAASCSSTSAVRTSSSHRANCCAVGSPPQADQALRTHVV